MPRPKKYSLVSLDNEQLAREALAIMDERGIEALSFRSLSERTGVPAMTISSRFKTKRELMKSALAIMLAEVTLPPVEGESWQDNIRRVARIHREIALAHPNSYALFLMIPVDESPVREFTERVFWTQRGQGVSSDQVNVFLSLLHSFLMGFHISESYANRGNGAALEGVSCSIATSLMPPSRPEADGFTVASPKSIFSEQSFERNLEIIIAGLERQTATM